MIVNAWRITKRKHARNAFTGEGAREFGGRWNNPGTAIVYTAQSQSLAALEMLVHLDSSELLAKYVLIGVEFDQALIRPVDLTALPRHWRSDPPPLEVRAVGDEWIHCWKFTGTAGAECPGPGRKQFPAEPGAWGFSQAPLRQTPGFSVRSPIGRPQVRAQTVGVLPLELRGGHCCPPSLTLFLTSQRL